MTKYITEIFFEFFSPRARAGLAGPGQEAGAGQVHSAAGEPQSSLHETAAAQVGGEAKVDGGQSSLRTDRHRKNGRD